MTIHTIVLKKNSLDIRYMKKNRRKIDNKTVRKGRLAMNNIKQSELNLTLEEFRLKYGIEKWQMFEALMMSEKAYEANRNKPVMKYAVSSPLIRNVIGDKSDKLRLMNQREKIIENILQINNERYLEILEKYTFKLKKTEQPI